MPHKNLPIREVEKFAELYGGALAEVIEAIPKYAAQFPKALATPPVVYEEGPSQVRRVLCYLALRKSRVWSDFVANRWPDADTTEGRLSLRWLKKDFIDSGLLARHKSQLPAKVQVLIP